MADNCADNQSKRGGFSAFIFCLFFYRWLAFGVVRFAKVEGVLCRQKQCIYAFRIALCFAGQVFESARGKICRMKNSG